MKKLTIVICILLSLLIVSCAEPDNSTEASKKEINVAISTEIFSEEIRADIVQIEFSYEEITVSKAFSEPIRIDVATDGKVDPIRITVKKGSSINYRISALDSNGEELGKKSGKITPAEEKDTIDIIPPRPITFKVTMPPDWNGPKPIVQYSLYINGLQYGVVSAFENGNMSMGPRRTNTSVDNTYKIEAKNSEGVVVAEAEGMLVFDDTSICNIPMPPPILVKE